MRSTLSRIQRRRRGEQGMTTSEYAVGTVGACGVGGVLYQLTQSEFFTDLFSNVISNITDLLPF